MPRLHFRASRVIANEKDPLVRELKEEPSGDHHTRDDRRIA
jgi:hypothetical protein